MRIGLMTDSTSYISQREAEVNDIAVIPLKVIFPDGQVFDETALDRKEYFDTLKTAKKLPTTSQPSAGEFEQIFQKMLNKGYEEILSIHISSGISGTVQSATMAKNVIPEKRIEIYDSHYAAVGLNFQVLEAARLIKEGKSIDEILPYLDFMRENTKMLFMVDTLEFLHKGGRIGGAQALLGSLLQIKPILTINVKVDTFDKVRTKQKALERLIEEVDKEVQKAKGAFKIGLVELEALESAKYLEEKLKSRGADIAIYPLGPAIGTHVGPGTVGVCFTHLP